MSARDARKGLVAVTLLLGLGCTAPAPPVPTPSLQGVTTLASGWTHSCALTKDGRVRCWGNNQDGQLGDGTRVSQHTPDLVVGLLGSARDVTVGERHTCILTASGGVKCWGSNEASQLGDGTRTDRVSPTEVHELPSGVRMVAAGERHTCAMSERGEVHCWGGNRHGQLGDGSFDTRARAIRVVELEPGIRGLAVGWRHTCVLTASGGVKCWGANQDGQLGDRTVVDKAIPVDVFGLTSGVAMIAAGARHTCAALDAGGVRCWGANDRGQLGNGTTDPVATIGGPIPGLTEVRALSAGWQHTCALAGKAVFCWGDNEKGQVIDTGTRLIVPTPVEAPLGQAEVLRVAAGGHHTCVLVSEGDFSCWGDNEYGQLGKEE
ncbi:hypothetical protein YTPLAS18_06570 [Nitrospira sp.]|nr:hypothetical protein YTPLAS18_06570 [Nitrospira sp.]